MKDTITLNGEQREIALPCTLGKLLVELGMADRPVVIEQNGLAVPSSDFADSAIHPGDKLEIISIVAGG